jgi:hypothetical protein
MLPIFPDDAPMDARREAAYARLMTMCPEPFRLIAKPMVKVAIEKASDDEISALLIDMERIPELAEQGDMDAIVSIAKRYGATEEMAAQYLPLFDSQKSA